MLIVHVHVQVKSESIESFTQATITNATHSLQEPGIARFDVIQDNDDPTRFILVEVYRTQEAAIAHKQTAHYATWRDTVTPMMATPRTSTKFTNRYPPDPAW